MRYLQTLDLNNLHKRIQGLFDIHKVELKKQLLFFCLSVLPRYGRALLLSPVYIFI